MISDNSVEPAATRSTRPAWRASAGPARTRFAGRLLLHGGQRRHPDRGRMCANWCFQEGHKKVGLLLGAGLVGHATTPTTSATPRSSSASTIITRGVARARTRATCRTTSRRCASTGAEAIVLRGLRLRDVPLRPGVQGARLGPAARHGHRVHVLFELQRVGRGPRGLARRRPARRGRHEPQLRRHDRALRGALRPHVAQRRRRARLRHRPRRHPRHRQRAHRHARRR